MALSLAVTGAWAQTPTDQAAAAEALFREARDLAAQGKHAEACPKFAASQRLDPGYGTLWNLADCLEKTNRTASAWVTFREAADLAKKAGQTERVEKAERRAADLEPKLERMVIAVKAPAPGLTVKRGGVALDDATWGAALPVDPGKHAVEASAPGKKTFTIEVQTKGPGQTVTVEIPALEDAAAAAPPPGPAVGVVGPGPGEAAGPAPDDGASTRRTLAYVAGGVGLAGVAVGTIFGLTASSKWSEAQDGHCRTETLCDQKGVDLTEGAQTAATISTVSFIVGGAALAAGVTLFVTSLGGGEKAAARVVVAPAVGSDGGGIAMRGRF